MYFPAVCLALAPSLEQRVSGVSVTNFVVVAALELRNFAFELLASHRHPRWRPFLAQTTIVPSMAGALAFVSALSIDRAWKAASHSFLQYAWPGATKPISPPSNVSSVIFYILY